MTIRIKIAAAIVGLLLAISATVFANDAVLLSFGASWCSPCQQMHPIIEDLKAAGYNVQDIDVDQQPDFAGYYKVDVVPQYIMVSGGHEAARITGQTSGSALKGLFEKVRKPAPARSVMSGPVDATTYRTPNFVCRASSQEIAQAVCKVAEDSRKQLAIDWIGKEFPQWTEPCKIVAIVDPSRGAGGNTNFVFHNGEVFGWDMKVFGPRERVLDSVVPHEVLHTVLATHFRQALPRWCDEGACTTVESDREQQRYRRSLYTALQSNRGIPFSSMFAMSDYPKDFEALYAQGHSLATFLIESRGQRHFVGYIGDGLSSRNWKRATADRYGYQSLAQLQDEWLEWVKCGSPKTGEARTANCRPFQFFPRLRRWGPCGQQPNVGATNPPLVPILPAAPAAEPIVELPKQPSSPVPSPAPQAPAVCQCDPSKDCKCDPAKLRELEIKIQRVEGDVSSVKREQEIVNKNVDALESKHRELALKVQNMAIIDQRIEDRLAIVERKLSGSIRFRLRFDPVTGAVTPVQ